MMSSNLQLTQDTSATYDTPPGLGIAGGNSQATVPVYQLHSANTGNFWTSYGHGFGLPQAQMNPQVGQFVTPPLLILAY